MLYFLFLVSEARLCQMPNDKTLCFMVFVPKEEKERISSVFVSVSLLICPVKDVNEKGRTGYEAVSQNLKI